MPRMNAGDFDKVIEFQIESEIQDESGYPVMKWVTFKKAGAMIKTMQGREYIQAATTKNEGTSRFVIRYTKGLHEDMRVLFRERIFDILSIINDGEENKTLTIVVKEKKYHEYEDNRNERN